MQKTFIGILVLIIAIVLFAFANAQPVSINLGFWKIQASLSLVLLISVTMGALISFLFSLPYSIRKNRSLKTKTRVIEKLQEQIQSFEKSSDNTTPNTSVIQKHREGNTE